MMKINLLDWREQRREQRKKKFIGLMVAAVVLALATLAVGFGVMNSALTHQKQRNQYLKQQIAEIDLKIKEIQELEKVKNNLLARMRVIEELQASRSATVHFFDELVNTLPDGVTLTAVKQTGNSVSIQGAAESNGRVSTYMKNLEGSPWFENPVLVVIKTSDSGNVRRSDFTLRVKNLSKAGGASGSGDEEFVE